MVYFRLDKYKTSIGREHDRNDLFGDKKEKNEKK